MIPKKRKILEGHKKVGKKLIPPMLQLPNLVLTGFSDDRLPDLIWMAPFFLKANDKVAVHSLIDFLDHCKVTLNDEKSPSLVFLSNFNKLTNLQKQSLIDSLASKPILDFLTDKLKHQNFLFHDYPLKFLFGGFNQDLDREESIKNLEQDVDTLLDRYSSVATKIQVTTIVAMMATGKMFISKEINLPDFNSIFTHPDSDEAKRAASFARANLNAGYGLDTEDKPSNTWPKSFWKQSFNFSGCR